MGGDANVDPRCAYYLLRTGPLAAAHLLGERGLALSHVLPSFRIASAAATVGKADGTPARTDSAQALSHAGRERIALPWPTHHSRGTVR
ncbi:MAG: hypothetical protein ONB23_13475 [candidate division KSB1 bacterium]|nr:hypothetical protein [candidate division KSB1 bacterium]